jgi:glutathione S-transferase
LFQIDQLLGGLTDTLSELSATFRMPEGKDKEEAQAKYWKDTFPKWGAYLEALLSKNNGGKDEGFFVGKSLSIADLAFYALLEGFLAKNKDCLKDFKVCLSFSSSSLLPVLTDVCFLFLSVDGRFVRSYWQA